MNTGFGFNSTTLASSAWFVGICLFTACSKQTALGPDLTDPVRGFVKSAGTELPIEGALISTFPPSDSLFSDPEGRFMFRIPVPGEYQLQASKFPFVGQSVAIEVFAEIETPPVTFLLRLSSPTSLEIVLIDSNDTSLTIVAVAEDPDGPGPLPVNADTLIVQAGHSYLGFASVWNDAPRTSLLDDEILRSKDAYRFVYAPEQFPTGRLVIGNLNSDNLLAEFGSTFTLQAESGPEVNGRLDIELRFHETLKKWELDYVSEFLASFPVGIVRVEIPARK